MKPGFPLGVRVARLALGVVVLAAAVAASLSPVAAPHAPPGWGAAAAGALLASASWALRRRFSPASSRPEAPQVGRSAPLHVSLCLLALGAAGQVAAATTQALAATGLPSPYLPLHETPGIGFLYLALDVGLAFALTWLTLARGRAGLLWSSLLGAGALSSVLYLMPFAVPEAGPGAGPILAMALIATSLAPWRVAVREGGTRAVLRSPVAWSLLFLGTLLLAAILSPVPGASLDFWVRLASLLLLAGVLASAVEPPAAWVRAALAVVLIAAIIPAVLALVKLLALAGTFGLRSALAYRLNPIEFGGANLVARSVLGVAPLALAVGSTGRPARRWIGVAGVGAAALVTLYAQSWEGLFALLASLAIYSLLVYGHRIAAAWQRGQTVQVARGFAIAGAILLLLLGIAASATVARSLNVYSFNGRFIHWVGAILAWRDHFWFGGGLSNDMLYTPYADSVGLFFPTRVSTDDPLHVIPVNAGRALWSHAHNLLLEVGAGGGLFAFLSLLGLLLALLALGWRALRRSHDPHRFWIAGCLAGLSGALAWGMLDALRTSPLFFAFPVWALAGLLVAAVQQSRTVGEGSPPRAESTRDRRRQPAVVCWLLAALAAALVLLPALGSVHYAAGFVGLQEQRWADTITYLDRAAHYRPIEPQPHALLAQAHLARQDVAQAVAAYRRALERKEAFSLYLSQLGWLAWLDGDVEQATDYFGRAIARDPAEIARWGLHADLGLAYAAQGWYERAIELFKESVERNPESVLAPYWVPVSGATASQLVLDPVYLQGPSAELDKRLLAHLGAPDVTARVFAPTEVLTSPISLADVLDAVEADYRRASAEGSSQAPLLLAALAEASRLVGLDTRAERAYLEFQALQPGSAYGFRDLGVLYRDQGRLEEAQAVLEHAVTVSPRDVDSRYQLALVYMDRQMWDEAGQALSTITSQSLTTLFHSRLFDPELYVATSRIHLAQGDIEGAIEARARTAAIRESPEDYLALAALYRRAGQEKEATGACLAAAQGLFATWPRPLNPLLWDIGTCLAQVVGDQVADEVGALAREHPLSGNVLLGHLYRGRGAYEPALAAYQAAADARPDEGAPHYLMGDTYQALGRPDRAEAEYRRAAQLDPLESLPLLALGRLQWAQGRHDEALDTLRAAVEATPGWGEAQVELGNALLALGDPVSATEHYHLARLADRDVNPHLVYDFSAQLASAEIESPGPGYVRNTYATVDGERQRSLFMHPDSRVRYPVELPAGARLAFDVATLAESWEQAGDGVSFAVYVQDGESVQQLFSTYIDPKQREADRRWHPFIVDLAAYAGRAVTIILETGAGPAGDAVYDWAVWGNPRLLAQ